MGLDLLAVGGLDLPAVVGLLELAETAVVDEGGGRSASPVSNELNLAVMSLLAL